LVTISTPRKPRRRKIDGDRAGERHQAEGEQQGCLRNRLRQAARQVIERTMRREHRQAGDRQHHDGAGHERGQRAQEQHFADRIDRDQPFAGRRRAGKQHRCDDHKNNTARHVLGPAARLYAIDAPGTRCAGNVPVLFAG